MRGMELDGVLLTHLLQGFASLADPSASVDLLSRKTAANVEVSPAAVEAAVRSLSLSGHCKQATE